MQEQPYLVFSLDDRRYSIDSIYLEEMLPLPEITLLPSPAQDIIGVINLRGDILPVFDLSLSLGLGARAYRTSDSLVILRQDQLRVGVIVSSIGELENRATLEVDGLDTRLQAQRAISRRKPMITGAMLSMETADPATDESPCWLLSPPEQWLRYVEIQQLISVAGVLEENPDISAELSSDLQPSLFCPTATPEERAIFQRRALSLRQSVKTAEAETLSTLAIVTVGNRYLAVDLSVVKEFTDIQRVTPIPCCPPYVVGNMNLRGEILTLIDIQSGLSSENPTPVTEAQREPLSLADAKVMVVEVEQYVVGVLVNTVLEAMFPLRHDEMSVAGNEGVMSIDQRFLQGVFSYRNATVGILDFPKILGAGVLGVEEVV